jgi:hypothetical protein
VALEDTRQRIAELNEKKHPVLDVQHPLTSIVTSPRARMALKALQPRISSPVPVFRPTRELPELEPVLLSKISWDSTELKLHHHHSSDSFNSSYNSSSNFNSRSTLDASQTAVPAAFRPRPEGERILAFLSHSSAVPHWGISSLIFYLLIL